VCPSEPFIAALPANATSADIGRVHAVLLQRTVAALQNAGVPELPSYNILWTRDWMMFVPRRNAGRYGFNANAAGMAGMVWVSRPDQVTMCQAIGLRDPMLYMGLPRDEGDT
jgi:ATP adenylyltransferase/5',5'''-P-1,P-4-tetraphosphate phosphorylase II